MNVIIDHDRKDHLGLGVKEMHIANCIFGVLSTGKERTRLKNMCWPELQQQGPTEGLTFGQVLGNKNVAWF